MSDAEVTPIEGEEPVVTDELPEAEAEVGAEPEASADAEPSEDAEPVIVDNPWNRPGQWFVVHTQSGYEKKVKSNLEARIQSMNMEEKIFEVAIPMEDVIEFKGGRRWWPRRRCSPATCSCGASWTTTPGTSSATRRA